LRGIYFVSTSRNVFDVPSVMSLILIREFAKKILLFDWYFEPWSAVEQRPASVPLEQPPGTAK
jgi:hypothetical protein